MNKYLYLATLILLISVKGFAQQEINANTLRKIVMKSDVIFASNNYTISQNYVNDYTVETFCQIASIDTLIKKNAPFVFANKKLRMRVLDEDYFLFYFYPIATFETMEVGKAYSQLFFLKKNGKQYEILDNANVSWENLLESYIPSILKIEKIEKISNLAERYTKNIDWFIEYDGYPDDGFVQYYQQKGIIKDSLVLSDEQLQKAKENYFKGKENVLPFIAEKFKPEITAYRLSKLREIEDLSEPDYYDFKRIVDNEYDFDYGSVDYILLNMIISDTADKYDKKIMMNHFIERLQQDLNQN